MTSTRFTVQTTLTASEVLVFLTDFGPTRSERWPNVDAGRFELHAQGDDWAEVTEGNDLGWERERYSWDAAAGTVTIETLESNLWGPGSGWKYQLRPSDGGTTVHVTLTRHANSFKGRLAAALIPIAGPQVLSRQFRSALRRAESG